MSSPHDQGADALAVLLRDALVALEKRDPLAAAAVVGITPKFPDLVDVPTLAIKAAPIMETMIKRLRAVADADRASL
jgi:hypothetical protein